MKSSSSAQHGFVLIELLVVIAIIAILMTMSLIAINPSQQLAAAHNVQIKANESAILEAIDMYEASNGGSEPPSITGVTTTPEPLAMNIVGAIDVCRDLVPNYLTELPIDPISGNISNGDSACDSETTSYNTGYTISQTDVSQITIAAHGFNGTNTIIVTQ